MQYLRPRSAAIIVRTIGLNVRSDHKGHYTLKGILALLTWLLTHNGFFAILKTEKHYFLSLSLSKYDDRLIEQETEMSTTNRRNFNYENCY